MAADLVTAGIVIIGDEILSGRTKDRNIGFIAEYLTAMGIDPREARVVPDVTGMIVEAVNTLRARYTYVFTCGGIGPTHDDITADAIGAAFGREVIHDPRALDILARHYEERGLEFNEARRRMARMPVGAELIENPVSKAPGFRVENVHVMAGVPSIMQAMMDSLAPTLVGGRPLLSATVPTTHPEGVIAAGLGAIAKAHPECVIGSYPWFDGTRYGTNLVARSRDEATLEAARAAIAALVAGLDGPPGHS